MSHFKNGCCSARHLCPRHREIARRYGREHRFNLDSERLDELHRLARARYGGTLPDNADGRRFAFVLAHVVGEPNRIRANLAELAPWYPDDDADKLIRAVAKRRYRWSADAIASPKWLNVSNAERDKLGLKTIGAYDMPKAEREKLRRDRYRPRKRTLGRAWRQRDRRKQGKPTRAEWLANSASRTKPWEAFGWCRRTWERHGKPAPGTDVASASSTYTVYKRERHTCDTPSDRLAPNVPLGAHASPLRLRGLPPRKMAVRDRKALAAAPHRNASTKVTRKRQGRPPSLRLTKGSGARLKEKKRAVRGRGLLSAQAPPQSLANVPVALTSPWGPWTGPPRGHVTVSSRLLSRPGAT
jgi:hypothetical protein